MGRVLRTVLAVCGIIGCAAGVAGQSTDLVLRDDLQRDVAFAHSPLRIIALLPSLTETVCALGECDRLVATDRFSDWPPRVKTLPKVGGLDDASIEAIAALKPDLVLLSDSQRITDRLAELGIKSFALDTRAYADVARTTQLIGQLLGVPERAEALQQTIEAAMGQIGSAAVAKRHGDGPRVYFEVDRAPYAAGPESFIGELLSRLGTRNIVTSGLGPYPKLNPEYVVRHNPQIIFVSSLEAARLGERPGWNNIQAVKEHRLCSFAAEQYETIVRPGPRLAEGMRALADCLQRVAP